MLDQISRPRDDGADASSQASQPSSQVVRVFIINLERDKDRRDLVLGQFSRLPGFEPRIVEGMYGRLLSTGVCEMLTQEKSWARHKGTIGCFLSHAKAWEEVASLEDRFAIVLEDDVDASGLRQLATIPLPGDAEIIFLNDRMSPAEKRPDGPAPLPIWRALQLLDANHGGPGGDGYLLTPGGARKLLSACLKDYYYGHVDGRLLQYATSEEDLAMLPEAAWIGRVVKYHRHPTLVPTLGLLRGYCLSAPLVRHLGIASIREAENRKVSEDGPQVQVPQVGEKPPSSRPEERVGLPIRYWNFVRNAGDQINPFVFEAVAGRRPYFSPSRDTEHVLGIGSIFFMATPQSHIWGSGILDPGADYSHVSPANIHAVRGKLTYDLLKEKYGLSKAVPLGDPGVFADEIPEIREYLEKPEAKRRVALIPHHGLLDHKYIRDIARHPEVGVINPRLDCIDFIKEIIASEIVVSQSLHGIIFAQVFGKPFTWLSHSSDDTWLFKFHDWFSTTVDAPRAPAMFGTPLATLLKSAAQRALAIDKPALRAAMPDIASDRKPGIGFREARRLSPLTVRIEPDPRAPASSIYDLTIACGKGEEQKLQMALQGHARRYDDSPNVFLIFDEALFSSLTQADIEECRTILDDLPDIHYLLLLPPDADRPDRPSKPSAGGRFAMVAREDPAHDWQGVVLARNPFGFSFSARGLLLARAQAG